MNYHFEKNDWKEHYFEMLEQLICEIMETSYGIMDEIEDIRKDWESYL